MTIQGKITDENGQPLPGAAIFESDQVGNLTGRGTTSRADGTFDLSVKVNSQAPGFYTIRFLGFRPLTLPKTTAYQIVQLSPTSFDLPPVEIKPQPKKENKILGWLALFGLLYFFNKKR